MIETLTFELVAVETPPLQQFWDDVERTAFEELSTDYVHLPDPWAQVLNQVCQDKDFCRCWDCGNAIGYHLDDQDVMRWRPLFLIRVPDSPIAWMCEDCVPQIPAVRWEEQTHD